MNHSQKELLLEQIAKALAELRIPSNSEGYPYMKTGIYLAYIHSTRITRLHVRIARYYSNQQNPIRIQLAIRYAIHRAYDKYTEQWQAFFDDRPLTRAPPPLDCMRWIAEHIRLKNLTNNRL